MEINSDQQIIRTIKVKPDSANLSLAKSPNTENSQLTLILRFRPASTGPSPMRTRSRSIQYSPALLQPSNTAVLRSGALQTHITKSTAFAAAGLGHPMTLMAARATKGTARRPRGTGGGMSLWVRSHVLADGMLGRVPLHCGCPSANTPDCRS